MPRQPRNNMKTSFFHIMVQGIKKEYIFNTKSNKEKYIKLLEKNTEYITILAYCIMSNHAHILIRTENIDKLSKWMHNVNTSFATYYNKKNERVGYVFRSRYNSQQITNSRYLNVCVNYIHNNPVKANICATQEEYQYSSLKRIYKCNQDSINKAISAIEADGYMLDSNEDKVFVFLEEEQTKEDVYKTIIDEITKEGEIEIKTLNGDIKELKKFVELMKNKYNIPYKVICKQLGISRETLRKKLKSE